VLWSYDHTVELKLNKIISIDYSSRYTGRLPTTLGIRQ